LGTTEKKCDETFVVPQRGPHVSFINNRAERDIPMAKVRQNLNPLVAIQMVLAGKTTEVEW
jgi:hypothetical protein